MAVCGYGHKGRVMSTTPFLTRDAMIWSGAMLDSRQRSRASMVRMSWLYWNGSRFQRSSDQLTTTLIVLDELFREPLPSCCREADVSPDVFLDALY
jgi:hypothetical protein